MGYYSTIKGNIEIKPVVPFSKLQELIEMGLAKGLEDKFYAGDSCVQVEYYSNSEVTDTGLLTTYEGWAIESASEDAMKVYSIIEDVQKIVDTLGTDVYRFQGFLEIEGEGDGSGEPDLWRIKVKDGRVIEVKPKIVWPED